MKSKYLILGILVLVVVGIVFIIGCAEQIEEVAEEIPPEEIETQPLTAPEEIPKEIFCADYDNDKEECLLHIECEWVSEENYCDPIGGIGEEEDDNDEEVDDKGWRRRKKYT